MDTRKLEELKQKVENLQEEKALLQQGTKEVEKAIAERKEKITINEQEMVSIVQSMMAESQMGDIRDRELTKDAINKMTHAQRETNKQIIKLNDYLSDTTVLKAVYETKREELEQDYQEHKKVYQEQKEKYDSLISDKKVDLAELERKYRNLKIKRIVRYTLIAAIILFILAFAIRWGTLLRNQISSNETKSEQVGEISTETEKTDTDENRGFLEWLLPADE